MAPKRKATNTGASTSPLKKRNAVTAGIGRAVEPENNGVAYNYYGRTDEREDVSKPIHPPIPIPVVPFFRNLLRKLCSPDYKIFPISTCFDGRSSTQSSCFRING